MKIQDKNYEDDYILLHPLRRKIVNVLQNIKEAYIKKIAQQLKMNDKDRLIGFHLKVLERRGFVKGRYALENPTPTPTIVRYYSLTPKTNETLKNLASNLQENTSS